MLQFDERTAKILDRAYLGRDFVTRRRANLDALDPRVGEHLADIGCGAGHMTAELGLAVGESGQVLGVDPSADMRALAEARCGDYDWVKIADGSAGQIPVEDGALDGAVSVQVFEYIDGIPSVLPEVHRKDSAGGCERMDRVSFEFDHAFSYPKNLGLDRVFVNAAFLGLALRIQVIVLYL